MEDHIKKSLLATFAIATAFIAAIIIAWSSWFITPEGHVDIVKRFSKAEYVATPGLNFKIPIITSTDTIEIRTRKNAEIMDAATIEQMPVKAYVSMNWSANEATILQLYKDYGSLAQFEERVIDPKFRAISKESIAKFTAEDTIGKRDLVESKLRDSINHAFANLPITISSLNIENIALPTNYLQSIETKQTEKNLADAEVFKLEKQNLEAQRAVNIAKAEAESTTVKAKAEADAIQLKGQAEATAIEAKNKAIGSNSNIVALTQAQAWNGVLPTQVMGTNIPMLMQLK